MSDTHTSAAPSRMNPPMEMLFRRLLGEIDSAEGSDWDATDSRLDAKVYCDPEIHRLEIERIFRRLPLCLGHADQLREPGSMLARDLLGLPLLLVRDAQGEIQVLLNVCRHRGARLLAGQDTVCHQTGLTCPYHAWRYDLTGALVGVPLAQGFPTLDPATRGLKRLPSTVRHGLIWAVLDPAQTSIDVPGLLGGVDDDLAAMDLGSHRFFRQRVQTRATNWKLVMDAFQEVYHIKRLHARTIAPFFLHAKSAGDAVGRHLRILVAREQLPDAQALPPEAWDVRRHATLTHGIFPNSMVIYHPDSTSHLGMFPTAPGEISFVHTMFTPHAARNDKEQAHWDRTFDMIDGGVFSAEDLFISEQIQQGVASGANDSFVLGRFEQHLRRFHGHVQDMLRG
jgi:phenylpropionate dioxygenase-like ring-hydroxylating dioxygenase large terminal subunit